MNVSELGIVGEVEGLRPAGPVASGVGTSHRRGCVERTRRQLYAGFRRFKASIGIPLTHEFIIRLAYDV
jgi:hypothetical protein